MTKIFPTRAGIAIAPILFIVALLSVLVAALASGTGSFGSAATTDRIKADVKSQANLIRAKVQECYMATMGNATFDYPAGAAPSGVSVTSMTCPGDPAGVQGLWTGKRPASLPATPAGFNPWVYFNYSWSGGSGRCIIITPKSTGNDVKDALKATATQFNAGEVYLDPTDASFSLWLSAPPSPLKKCGT